jgi:XapX domain-containing protein
MKAYLISLAVGLMVGVIYNLLNVRSPAPPVIALVGLLGILAGEQIPPLIKSAWLKEPLALAWIHQVRPHVFGSLAKGQRPTDRFPADKSPTVGCVGDASSTES